VTRAADVRDVWTSPTAMSIWAEPVEPGYPPPKDGVVEVYLPKTRSPAGEEPRLADLVIEMLEVVEAVAVYKQATCDRRRVGECIWQDHGPGCAVEIARRRMLDAHAVFETRVLEEHTS